MEKPSRVKDLAGIRYGRLVVEEYAYNDDYSGIVKHYWKCKCDCGKTAIVSGDCLRSGYTKSCGCLRSEMMAKRGKEASIKNAVKITFNGETDTIKGWSKKTGIKPMTIYHRYKSGKKVEDVLSKESLLKGGIRKKPDSKLIKVKIFGEEYSIKELSKKTGLSYYTIYNRIARGATDEEIISKNKLDTGWKRRYNKKCDSPK